MAVTFEDFVRSSPALHPGVLPFALEPGALWLVLEGSLSIFLGPDSQGAPEAPYFVLQIQTGQAVVGMTSCAERRLYGQADSDTKLAHLQLADCPRDPGLQKVVESWLTALGGVAAGGLQASRKVRPIVAHKAMNVPEGGCMTSQQGVVWLPQQPGMLDFVGEAPAWAQACGHFPVATSYWLQARQATPLEGLAWEDWIQLDGVAQDLDNFHTVCIKRLVQRRAASRERHQQRLQEKASSERATLQQAMAGLTSVFQAESTMVTPEAGDPLLAACQQVGRALGVEIRDASTNDQPDTERLEAIARASRLLIRRVRLHDKWWRRDGGPLLARLEESGRPVAIIPAAGGYVLNDPGRRAVDETVAATLEGHAFAFYRTFPARPMRLFEVIRFGLFRSGSDLITMLVVLIGAALLSTILPILTGILFGSIIPQSLPGQLLPLVMALAVSALASASFEVTRGLAMLRFQGRSSAEVGAAITDRVLHLPLPFFRRFSAGNLAARAEALTSILQILTDLAVGTFMGGIVSLANFCLLFYFDPRLALTATLLALIAVLVTLFGGYRNLAYARSLNQLQNHLKGVVMQLLAGISKLRSTGSEKRAFAVWARGFAQQRQVEVAQRKLSNWLLVFNSAYPLIATMAIYASVASLKQGTVTTASFLAFNAAFGSFFSAFLSMGSSLLPLLNAVPLYEQALPILETEPECDPDKLDPGELSGALEVSQVSFGYSADGPRILHDISFKIAAGEFVAVVGSSGAGKSTVARLLLGLEKPSSGSVYYDGKDLAQLDTQALRRRMGVVLQNVQLLPGSIFSVIAGNHSSATVEQAWEAVRAVGMEAELKALPMGMQTWIGEGAGTLSGGQRQRLTIARAILSKPKILILDEATSALDNESQAIVTESLSQLTATRLVIAHRLSTIRQADRILVVHGGRIEQQGTFESLEAQPGVFRELVQRQMFAQ